MAEPERLASLVFRRIFWRSTAVNVLVMGLAWTYGAIGVPTPAGEASRMAAVPLIVAVGAAYFGGGLLLQRGVLRVRFRPIAAWLATDGPPIEAVRSRLFGFSWWFARLLYVLWIVAALMEASLALRFYPLGVIPAGLAVGILFVGLIACTLSFLLTENAMRPVYERALRWDPSPPSARGEVLRRLMLSWCFSSGAFLLLSILGPIVLRETSQFSQLRTLIFLNSGLGIAVGIVSILFASRTLTDRLKALRDAQVRVEQGDLSAQVAVDDRGELGMLLAGFNRMVAGLREREHLHD
ncbi:MAG: HAMP domain-containing protein, partial [Actinomycetota bacterium]